MTGAPSEKAARAMTVDPGLAARLKRLMLFRVVMVTTLLMIAVGVEAVSETLEQVNPLYFVIVATYILTLGHALALRLLGPRVFLVFVQVLGDIAVITCLVYLAGGVRGGFLLLYPISVLSGSVLLVGRGGLWLATIATACYAAILWSVRLAALPARGLADVPYLPGKELYFSVLVTAVACGTVALIGSYFAESLRQAGERLEEAHGEVADLRELNQVIVSSIQSGLVISDPETRILYVNDFGAQLLGLAPSEVRGRNLSDLFLSPLLQPAAIEVRAASRTLRRLDVAYARPGGPLVQLGVTLTPLAERDRTGRGFLLVFQDLTEIKRLEHEVRTKEKLAAVGEMTAQLAHEIRNPLGSISGSAQVLLAEPGISSEQQRLLAIITRESRRLSDTLNRFLFQARPASSPRDPIELGPLLEQAVTLLRHGEEVRPGHRVTLEIGPGHHVCLADPDQVTQVFWNLARNGLEAMTDGGTLAIALRGEGHDIVLSVKDEGRGMAGEEQQRLFEPFQSRSAMGTGLGLSIVYRIVREHGGDIAVRSEPARGTEVVVRLPRALAAGARAELAPPRGASSGRSA
jgi:two-component system sensor histidine kinase PilS (NtrC family)